MSDAIPRCNEGAIAVEVSFPGPNGDCYGVPEAIEEGGLRQGGLHTAEPRLEAGGERAKDDTQIIVALAHVRFTAAAVTD